MQTECRVKILVSLGLFWFEMNWKFCFLLLSCFVGLAIGKIPPSLFHSRILSEFKELRDARLTLRHPFQNTSTECGIRLAPVDNKFLEWHFSFLGDRETCFRGGCYHGRILLNREYPRVAPKISLLTPNGRWEVGKDICLSATSYHQESWDPNWNLRTLVLGLKNHMTTQPREIGSVMSSNEERQSLALKSRHFNCKSCKLSHSELLQEGMAKEALPQRRDKYPTTQHFSLAEKSGSPHQTVRNKANSFRLLSWKYRSTVGVVLGLGLIYIVLQTY